MSSFLRLVRFKNLLIVAFTMSMTVYGIINPVLQLFNIKSDFMPLDIVFLILACVFVTAGGYVINDYFDTKTDRINRPETLIVSNTVSRTTAIAWHIILSVLGCLLGFMVSMRIGVWKLGLIYPLAVGLLWYYSAAYKKMFLVGNLVVAFLTGLVVILPALYEVPVLMRNPSDNIQYGVLDPFLFLYQTSFLAGFAFMTTLTREIIKDLEDTEGDKAYDAHTLAIVFGMKKTKITTAVLNILTTLAVTFIMLNYLPDTKSYIYISVFVIAPLIYLTYKILKIQDKKDCHFCSTFMKIIMLLGILYLLVMRYNFLTFKDEF